MGTTIGNKGDQYVGSQKGPQAYPKDNKFHSRLKLLYLDYVTIHGLSHLAGELYLLTIVKKKNQLFPVLLKAIITLTHGVWS